MIRTRIVGTGGFLPEKVLTNKDIEAFCDTTDEWITKRSGIRQRHIAEDGVGASALGVEAARMALADAGVDPMDLDAVVCATVTPDMVTPSVAIIMQSELGAKDAAAFDINAACSGFVYGLATARGLIDTGVYKTILLVGAETISRLINWDERATAVLFADGAGAVVLRGVEGDSGVLSTHLGADGSNEGILNVQGGGFRHRPTPEYLAANRISINMNGREVFKRAVTMMVDTIKKSLADAGLGPEDVDLFVPHQANARIIEAARERLGLDPAKVVLNIDRTGNTSAASIPMALNEAKRAGRLHEGDCVLMAAFGAGLTWGSAVIRW